MVVTVKKKFIDKIKIVFSILFRGEFKLTSQSEDYLFNVLAKQIYDQGDSILQFTSDGKPIYIPKNLIDKTGIIPLKKN